MMEELFKNYKTEELVSLYQHTFDETYLEEILNRNNGLLHQWIQKYSNIPYFSSEDLYSEACEALWRAVLDYNPEKEVAFTTFLKISVFQKFNRIYNEVTRKKRYTGTTPISYESLAEINKERFIEISFGSKMDAEKFISSLSGRTQKVAILLSYGYTKKEISVKLGITPASISFHCRKLEWLARAHFYV